MKIKAIAVFVFMFLYGLTSYAQDMVEYSHAAAKSAAELNALASKVSGSLQKSAGQTSTEPRLKEIPNSPSKTPASGASKSTTAAQDAAPKPTPPAVFILNDGKQIESSHYLVTAQSVEIQDGAKPQTIPLSALNRNATVAENQKRGLSINVPNSPSQMTISF